MKRKAYCIVLAVICLIGLTDCGSSNSGGGQSPQGESITATAGTPQSATVGAQFATQLQVTVTTNGSPTSGVVVTFTAPASTGPSGTFTGGTTTNSMGIASVTFTANGIAGSYVVIASVAGVTTQAHFSLTNDPGSPASIQPANNSTPQDATIDTAFATNLAASVLDSYSNPVPGVVVIFTAPATGASGTFAGGANTVTATTGTTGAAIGIATAPTFTANGAVGPYVVTASVGGVPGASFSLTNTVGTAASITVKSGTPQSATLGAAFAAPLVATVSDSGGNPVSSVVVTFSAPSSGASGTFAGGINTATTDSSGVATSQTFTANSTTGTYTVTASVAGVTGTANFTLTNTLPAGSKFSFYLSGLEAVNEGPNFYALAGSVDIDSSGNVVAGEQDYNDGTGTVFTSPEPSGDTITGGTLAVNATTGQGTLTLVTNNINLGVLTEVNGVISGVETLGIQFVNSNHALIIQFDGTATSSGSLDLQTLPSTLSGGYAFTLSGVDSSYASNVIGGVFTISGTTVKGVFDVDDFGAAATTPTLGTPFTDGTISTPDSFGRGAITSPTIGLTLNYYIVGPEAIRIIDVDTEDSAVGSAFGQGTNITFTNSSLGPSDVFGVQSNWEGNIYAAAGMLTTNAGAGTFLGIADDNEVQEGVSATAASISGTYSISNAVNSDTYNGYGSLTINSGDLGDVSVLGIYMTDPQLNLTDPNNKTSGLGGALVADLDGFVLNGTGIVMPQTSTSAAAFSGDYAFGAQEANLITGDIGGEFDFVGQGTVTNLALSGTGLVSDPWSFFASNPIQTTFSGVTFSGTADADASNAGRYTFALSTSLPLSPDEQSPFGVVIYEASGGELFWLQTDSDSVFLGTLQQQGSLSGLPAATKSASNTAAQEQH